MPQTRNAAHRLFIEATACWFGGTWSDALGVEEPHWPSDAEGRCRDVVKQVNGSEGQASFERLRAIEATEVADVRDKIAAIAQQDSVDADLQGVLDKLVPAVADALRETMFARRAGDKVKLDTTRQRAPSKLTSDELAAVQPLRTDAALRSLLDLDSARLTPEARAIAILCALDRMGTARWLPKHLKVYVVEGPFKDLFGVEPPEVVADATRPLPGGLWLAYLEKTATAAGHSVPSNATSLEDQELMAWDGVLMGLADRLQSEAARISDVTDLKRVAQETVRRIDAKYRASQQAILAHAAAAG